MQLGLLGIFLHQEDAGICLRILWSISLALAIESLYWIFVGRETVEVLISEDIVVRGLDVPEGAGCLLDIIKHGFGVDLERLDKATLVNQVVIPLVHLFVFDAIIITVAVSFVVDILPLAIVVRVVL